jgi:acyl transferase
MLTTGGFIPTSDGQKIVVFANLISDREAKGTVLIVPPFGRSAKDLFIFAHYLWKAGFNVFRFDARNHVGLSSGEIRNFTLSSLLKDLRLVTETLRGKGFDDLTLLCISLSAPVTFKYAAGSAGVRGIVSVIGAVDVQFAVEKAGNCSLDAYRRKDTDRLPSQTILGYEVLADEFVRDMDAGEFSPLDSVVEAVRRAPCPVHIVMAADDDWVPPERMMRVHQAAPEGSTLTSFEGVSHEFGRSVKTTKRICLEICRLCGLTAGGEEEEWQIPNFAELLGANTAEASSVDTLSQQALSQQWKS